MTDSPCFADKTYGAGQHLKGAADTLDEDVFSISADVDHDAASETLARSCTFEASSSTQGSFNDADFGRDYNPGWPNAQLPVLDVDVRLFAPATGVDDDLSMSQLDALEAIEHDYERKHAQPDDEGLSTLEMETLDAIEAEYEQSRAPAHAPGGAAGEHREICAPVAPGIAGAAASCEANAETLLNEAHSDEEMDEAEQDGAEAFSLQHGMRPSPPDEPTQLLGEIRKELEEIRRMREELGEGRASVNRKRKRNELEDEEHGDGEDSLMRRVAKRARTSVPAFVAGAVATYAALVLV